MMTQLLTKTHNDIGDIIVFQAIRHHEVFSLITDSVSLVHSLERVSKSS